MTITKLFQTINLRVRGRVAVVYNHTAKRWELWANVVQDHGGLKMGRVWTADTADEAVEAERAIEALQG